MIRLVRRCRDILATSCGQSITEYALIVGMIAIVLIAVLVATRVAYAGIFSRIGSGVSVWGMYTP